MTTNAGLNIAVVSDVSLGFGSPQVQSLARSLAEHYHAPVTIYEPDQTGRPRRPISGESVRVRRISTDVSPHSRPGRIEYVLNTAAELNRERPDIVLFCCTFTLPVLGKLAYRPRSVIYALIEMIAPYGSFDVAMNRALAPRIDMLIIPEENRARLDMQRCGFAAKPLAVLYNVSDTPHVESIPTAKRLRRLYYGGAVSNGLGLAEYLLHPDMRNIPLDIYGDVGGTDRAALLQRLKDTTTGPRYLGCYDAASLARLRRHYAYAVVMYRPTTDYTHYAAPNKFFEAIADGVPPIAAPHPQCQMIVERYRCGILMRDWSFEAYRDAVHEALQIFGTRRYARMVMNCERAVRTELNWPAQFAKLERLLPAA